LVEYNLESELVAGFMTEHGASIFVFFFLGEYSSLILMSAFMSIFFLGGHHCPDLHKLILDPINIIYYEIEKVFSFINISVHYLVNITTTYIEKLNKLFLKYEVRETGAFVDSNNLLIHNNENFNKLILELKSYEVRETGAFVDSPDLSIYVPIWFWNWKYLVINDGLITQFSIKDTVLNSIHILIDKIQGSYVLGFKIILVVFFYIWVRASFPRLRYDQLMSLCWKELLPLVFAYIIFTISLFYTFDMMPFGTAF
jgi:hypothetical protein